MQKLFSACIYGISGQLVEVEVDVVTGMGQFTIVGLGDAAIQESRERVRSALKNSGFRFPGGARITVNLAPADLRKKGPLYDLPIALGILGKEIEFRSEFLEKSLFLGELALDGIIRPIQGALPAAILARELGMKYIFLPYDNMLEASVIPDIEVIGVKSLTETVNIISGVVAIPEKDKTITFQKGGEKRFHIDFSHIIGQEHAKRALLIAAAGGHNILLEGPPGSGKTMLAKALSGILPDLELEEQIELSKIYSVAGLLSKERPIVEERPFRTVHHTASEASVIGGGREARPGEISLAHKGVLFLDEFLEFSKSLLETLRQPLEDGEITINRVHQSCRYPARFSLVGAMNPCPCGFLGDQEKKCTCSPMMVDRYRSRLSGPILDRVDLFLQVPRVKVGELGEEKRGKTSAEMKHIVMRAKAQQKERFASKKILSNAEMSNIDIEKLANIEENALKIAITSTEKLQLSTRVYYRILRVARTIADIEDSKTVSTKHILEALSYRGN